MSEPYDCEHGNSCFTCKDCTIQELTAQLAEARHSYDVLKIVYDNLEKTHYETTYDRVQRLESQLAEARAEVERYKKGITVETKVEGVPVSMWKEAHLPRIPLPIEYMDKKVSVLIMKLEG